MKFFLAFILCAAGFYSAAAQQDTEFPKEFIMHLKLHNGMVTDFKGNSADMYVGGLQLVPQYTIVPHLLRGGIILDGFYTDKKVQGAFGPTLSIKLKSLQLKPFGTAGNIHLNLDYLWGSEQQRMVGGGINIDIGNKLVLGLTGHRDYGLNSWWIQHTLGLRISSVKKKVEEFN